MELYQYQKDVLIEVSKRIKEVGIEKFMDDYLIYNCRQTNKIANNEIFIYWMLRERNKIKNIRNKSQLKFRKNKGWI